MVSNSSLDPKKDSAAELVLDARSKERYALLLVAIPHTAILTPSGIRVLPLNPVQVFLPAIFRIPFPFHSTHSSANKSATLTARNTPPSYLKVLSGRDSKWLLVTNKHN